MNKFLIAISCIVTFISCADKKLESRVTALEKKFNYTNDSVKLITYSEGLLHQNDKIKNEDEGTEYWDIPLDKTGKQKSIPFVYHRKNESELWQPIYEPYFTNEYVRINGNFGAYNNEQYLIVQLNYDIKKKKIVFE